LERNDTVTEADWNSSHDPREMLAFLRDAGQLSERKARLFAVACCRRIWWEFLKDRHSRNAVEVAERYADGQAREEEMLAAWDKADTAFEALADEHDAGEIIRPNETPLVRAAGIAAWATQENAIAAGEEAIKIADSGEQQQQVRLLRDLFGPLPFRPMTITPSLLKWRDRTIVKLAQAAYDNRQLPAGTLEQERLMVLADALEEAGARDQEVLRHLREPGRVHVRGCHVVDLILGKS
jgi:hypothetical protein